MNEWMSAHGNQVRDFFWMLWLVFWTADNLWLQKRRWKRWREQTVIQIVADLQREGIVVVKDEAEKSYTLVHPAPRVNQ